MKFNTSTVSRLSTNREFMLKHKSKVNAINQWRSNGTSMIIHRYCNDVTRCNFIEKVNEWGEARYDTDLDQSRLRRHNSDHFNNESF